MQSNRVHSTKYLKPTENSKSSNLSLSLRDELGQNKELSAEIVSLKKSGIEIRVAGRILQAVTKQSFQVGEKIEMESQTTKSKEWNVIRRTFPIYSQSSNSFQVISNISIASRNSFHKRESIADTIETFFRQDNDKTEILPRDIPKILSQLFPFFEWGLGSELFNWIWKDSNASGYSQSSKEGNTFLLEYNSEGTGLCRFLILWKKKEDSWNVLGSIQDMNFYERLLLSTHELRSALLSIIPGLSTFEIEYISSSYKTRNKGWVA